MIDEKVLRKQLVPVNPIADWILSFDEEIRERVNTIKKNITDVMYIDMSNIDNFKKSIEDFKKQNPNANIQATGFVISTKSPEQNTEFKYPEANAKDITKTEDIMKSKAKPKSTAKKSKTTKRKK